MKIFTLHNIEKKSNINSNYSISIRKLNLILSDKNYNFFEKEYISFDDGLLNQYNYAFPLLKQYNIKAIFFIVTRCITDEMFVRPIDLFYSLEEKFLGQKINIKLHGKEIDLKLSTSKCDNVELKNAIKYSNIKRSIKILNTIANELNINLTDSLLRNINKQLYMKNEHIKELASAGHIIGNHSHMHQLFNKLSEKELLYELLQSKEIIKSITGDEKQLFAYPYGGTNSYNNFTNDLIKQNGFIRCFTNTGFSNSNADFLVHRTDIS